MKIRELLPQKVYLFTFSSLGVGGGGGRGEVLKTNDGVS